MVLKRIYAVVPGEAFYGFIEMARQEGILTKDGRVDLDTALRGLVEAYAAGKVRIVRPRVDQHAKPTGVDYVEARNRLVAEAAVAEEQIPLDELEASALRCARRIGPIGAQYQCPDTRGHGPGGLYCRQHADMGTGKLLSDVFSEDPSIKLTKL